MLTPAELCLLADEIQRLSVPARIDKIHQPKPDRVVLRLVRDGHETNLLIAASRAFARAHFVDDVRANPRSPPPFCEDLRRLLMPGRIVGARTLPHDAVLVLDCEIRVEGGGAESRRLVAELFGMHPNILVVGADGRILAVLAPREARGRTLAVSEKYVEPGRPEKELAPRAPFVEFGPTEGTLSRLVEEWVSPRESAAIVTEARDALLASLKQEEKKLRRRLDNIDRDVRGADEVPRLRREGELLKAHLGEMKRGMKQLVATEWHESGGEKISIPLDPMRTPQQEVAFRFDEARRLERQREAAAERRGEVEDRLRVLEAFANGAGMAESEEEVAAIRDEAGIAARAQPTPGKKPRQVQESRKPYRTFVSKDGIEMMVGRTARDNDELTFKIANGNDFWFHVRDYPGSHVVIRARDQLPEETMLDAATLAVHFSRGKAGGKRDVSWTRRKFVAKAKGAPAGQVLLSTHKTILMRPDPARLARLLQG